MSIAFISINEADAVRARDLLVRKSWKRDWSEDLVERYFSWRYGARGTGETLVACEEGRCVGILDSFIRPYSIAGRQEVVRETCDWFCLPEYRPLGVGLHLMRLMMAKPEPILVIGGTDDTRNLLPRLKWAQLPDVDNFILGISARTVAGLVARRWWRGGSKLARVVPEIPLAPRLPQWAPPSANSRVRIHVLGDAEQVPKIAPYDLAPALDTKVLDWLSCAPAVLGQFLLLDFVCDGEPAGISISRLEEVPAIGCISQIIHLHATRFDLINWMASATVSHLIERGAGVVLCRASCPTTARALSALGFWRRKPIAAHWWPPNKLPQPGLLHLTALQADDALQFH